MPCVLVLSLILLIDGQEEISSLLDGELVGDVFVGIRPDSLGTVHVLWVEAAHLDLGEVFLEVLKSNEEGSIFRILNVVNLLSHLLAPALIVEGPTPFPSASSPWVTEVEQGYCLVGQCIHHVWEDVEEGVGMVCVDPELLLILLRHVVQFVGAY